MRRTIISIPQPCHEKWQGMKPTETGRHCAACRETVVDFTQMSDAAIVEFLRRYPTVSCGRFTAEQLDRPLYASAPDGTAGWRQWLATLVTVIGMSQLAAPKAVGQQLRVPYYGGPVPADVGQAAANGRQVNTDQPAPLNLPPAASQDVYVHGVVRNWWGHPLKNARVEIADLELETQTDAHGQFSLRVPQAQITDDTWLSVSSNNARRSAYVALEPGRLTGYEVRLKRRRRPVFSGKFR